MTDILLAVLALAVGVALAWRAGPVARLVLFGSAMLISALLFMPGEQITGAIGSSGVLSLRRLAAKTPWDVSAWTHFLLFAWLGLLLWLARKDLRSWRGVVLVGALGVAAELSQWLTDGRQPKVEDAALNVFGGLVGISLAMMCRVVVRCICNWRARTGGRSAG